MAVSARELDGIGVQEEEKILYDVLEFCEWPETVTSLPFKEGHFLWRDVVALARACVKFAVVKLRHPFSSLGRVPVLPPNLVNLVAARLPWQLTITSDGSFLAVLRDATLEIRCAGEDLEYGVVTAQVKVGRDASPQWRKVVWSEDGALLAVGTSNGSVSVFTQTARCIFTLPGRRPVVADSERASPTHAVASLTFLPPPTTRTQGAEGERERDHFLWPLLAVLHYSGRLDTYQIRPQGSPVHLHTFSFRDYYPSGVTSMVWHPSHRILIVGSCPTSDGSPPTVSGWRLVNEQPYWAPMPGQSVEKKPTRLLGALGISGGQQPEHLVFRMSLSPSGHLLAAIDVSGQLSVWELPSLRPRRAWTVDQLPVFDIENNHPVDSGIPKQKGPPLPLDVSWWSDEALILTTTAAEVAILSVSSLSHLLGHSPRLGECITSAHNGQIVTLECESRQSSAVGRYRLPSLSETDEEEEDREEHYSVTGLTTNFLKQALYFLTESETFRPPYRKPKVVMRRYRLKCLRSVTPEECYERKMSEGMYVEALVLAKQYGLDCDRVFQWQWLDEPITMETIDQYLSKVTKRSWVLQECLSRVPQDYEAVRELLLYGLTRTSFKELKEVGPEEGGGALCNEEEEEEVNTTRIEEEVKAWERLTHEQTLICQRRHMLLSHLDRLSTYEAILGGPREADESFDCQFFEEFRSCNLVAAAISFARDSNSTAVATLFTYHGEDVLPHRLAVLSNFPETTPPQCYQTLLPEVSPRGEVGEWLKAQHRSPDWVDTETLRSVCSLPSHAHTSSGAFLYEENANLEKYRAPLSGKVLTEWYTERATEIEDFSGQVDNALSLVELGVEKGVKSLELLHHHLLTLNTLVYMCNVDNRLNLHRLQQMSNLEIVQLMMRDVSAEDTEKPIGDQFVQEFRHRVQPFLGRVDRMYPGERKGLMQQYLTWVAKDDLVPCLSVFQCSSGELDKSFDPLVMETEELLSLALKCIYSCTRSDQLDIADHIVDCLPSRTAECPAELAELHNQLDNLHHHLSALYILKEYEVLKPIHFLKDSQDSSEEAEKLLTRLTRVASKQQPPFTEADWRKLLDHLLSLWAEVFSACVDQDTCYKLFTESLLCSGQEHNIQLASHLLTTSPSSLPTPPSSLPTPPSHPLSLHGTGFDYRLSYETSTQLVVKAAMEYFNSAAGPRDGDMQLARSCLGLFASPPPPPIQQEFDLISSLSVLEEFGVTMLPVLVRLTENKLDIIRTVLATSSTTAYRKHEKILQLSRLLGLDQGEEPYHSMVGVVIGRGQPMSEGRGHTLILITLSALETSDYKTAPMLCSRLMEARFPPAWEVCRKLGLQDQFRDVGMKMSLLNFALTHCPPEEIEATLQERNTLEIQALSLRCQALSPSPSSSAGGAVQQLVGRGVQHIVTRSAGAVQQLMGQRLTSGGQGASGAGERSCDQRVQDCVDWLVEAEAAQRSEGDNVIPLPGPSYHPFYGQLVDDGTRKGQRSTKHQHTFQYGDVKSRPVELHLLLSQALLRAVQVTNSLSLGERTHGCTQALLQLAKECSRGDTHLLLGYLLSLATPEDADKILSKLAPSEFSLQLAIFYTCLQLYARTAPTTPSSVTRPHPFLHPPLDLVHHVTRHVTSVSGSDWSPDLLPLVELLQHYRGLLADLTEAGVLQGLGLGIDVQLFTQDRDYRHGSVLYLARTSDVKVFSIALSLASRHHVPENEVYLAALDWLLTTSGLTPAEVQQKVTEMKVMDVLLGYPQETADSLRGSTYPNLPGNKHGMLIVYFSLLQRCLEAGAQVEGEVDIETHLKLLKRLRNSLPGVDHKALMSGEKPLSVLCPFLTSTNLNMVAKMADSIPCKGSDGGTLTPGMVFSAFAEGLFWHGDRKHQATPRTKTDWMHRYECCYDYLLQLSPDEFTSFVHNIILSPQGLKLPLDVRVELMKRAVKFARQKLKPETAHDGITDPSFEDFVQELQRCLKHLQNLSSPEVAKPAGVAEDVWKSILEEFDLSLSLPNKVQSLSSEMVGRGLPLGAISSLLSLAKSVRGHSLSTKGLVLQALGHSLELLSEDSHQLERIENILQVVSQHESEGGGLVVSGDVLEVLKPYCSDSAQPGDRRRALLQIMEKCLYLSSDETSLLLFYQTQSIVSQHFNTQVSPDDLSSLSSQEQLFSSLLLDAHSLDQLLSLATLLQTWTTSGSLLQGCWVSVLESLASAPEGAPHVVMHRAGLQGIPHEVDHRLYAVVLGSSPLEALKLALVSFEQDLLQKALDNWKQYKDDEITVVDADLVELILLRGQLPAVRGTVLYPSLCFQLKHPDRAAPPSAHLFARLLNCPQGEVSVRLSWGSPGARVKKAASQLYAAGMTIEAGSLALTSQVFHPGLLTVNSAIELLNKLFQ